MSFIKHEKKMRQKLAKVNKATTMPAPVKVKVRLASPDSYFLERLFDPEELYYIPMSELLKRYKKRDFLPGRIYNLAKKYGHVPESRERKIIMPKMERASQRILGDENFYQPPPKVFFCNRPNEPVSDANGGKKFTNDRDEMSEDSGDFGDNEPKTDYEWLKERRKLRDGLNAMDLNMDYLKRKKDLNEMEKRVLYAGLYFDKEIQTDMIVRDVTFLHNYIYMVYFFVFAHFLCTSSIWFVLLKKDRHYITWTKKYTNSILKS